MTTADRLRILVYGDIGGSGGYSRYCKGLFGSNDTPKDIDVLFVCSQSFFEQIKPLDEEIKVIASSWMESTNRMKRYLWHLILYPQIVRNYSPQIEFYPSGQLRVYFRKATTVAACHNLLLFDDLELSRMGDLRLRKVYNVYKNNQKRSFKNASGVIFSSEYSQNLVIEKIPSISTSTVVPLGVEEISSDKSVRNFDISKRINLLYVSPLWPYKHHKEVIQAVRGLREQKLYDLHLLLIGSGIPSEIRVLHEIIKKENASNYVTHIKYVDEDELLKAYEEADVFIFASSCEAFGITLVEAMRAKLPIACSNLVGLPSILKDAGEYFNPSDPISISIAIDSLLKDKNLREKLGEKAYQYSLFYTWKRCSNLTYSFLRKISAK